MFRQFFCLVFTVLVLWGGEISIWAQDTRGSSPSSDTSLRAWLYLGSTVRAFRVTDLNQALTQIGLFRGIPAMHPGGEVGLQVGWRALSVDITTGFAFAMPGSPRIQSNGWFWQGAIRYAVLTRGAWTVSPGIAFGIQLWQLRVALSQSADSLPQTVAFTPYLLQHANASLLALTHQYLEGSLLITYRSRSGFVIGFVLGFATTYRTTWTMPNHQIEGDTPRYEPYGLTFSIRLGNL